MSNPGVPQPDQIPVPDTSGLPDQSAPNQYAMENANQAMQAQPQPPPVANPSAIKGLLTNFFGGMGRAMMVHAGLPTPEDEARKQQQLQLQQQNANSLEGIRTAQQAATELHPYQMPSGPDGTPGEVFQTNAAGIKAIQVQQLKNAANPNLQMTTIGPEHVKINPQLAPLLGQRYPTMLLDKSILGTAATQNKALTAPPPRASAAARDDRYIKLQGQDPRTWTADDQQFIKGYSKYVDVNKVQPGLQRAQVMAAPRWAALDPERQAQIALAKGMATGPLANQLSSFNAFVGHLGDFHDAAQELKNSDYKLYNTAMNRIALESGDPKIQGIIAKIEPVRKEFESLLLNNRALYEADRKSADVILSPSSSPSQIEVAVKSLAGTAAIRLGAVNQNVKRIAGNDIPELLEPANGSILEELGAQIPGYTGNGPDFSQTFKSPQGPANRPRGGAGGGKRPTHRYNPATGKIEVIP